MQLPLDGDGSNLGEAVDNGGRRDYVTVFNKDSPATPTLDLVPGLADEGDQTSILVTIDKGEHVLQHLLREQVIYSRPHVQWNTTTLPKTLLFSE